MVQGAILRAKAPMRTHASAAEARATRSKRKSGPTCSTSKVRSAARQGDGVNPERRSSGVNFTLFKGVNSENELDGIEGRIASFANEYGMAWPM